MFHKAERERVSAARIAAYNKSAFLKLRQYELDHNEANCKGQVEQFINTMHKHMDRRGTKHRFDSNMSP